MPRNLKYALTHPVITFNYVIDNTLAIPFWNVIAFFEKKSAPPAIKNSLSGTCVTSADEFWNIHTVIGAQLASVKTARQSNNYLKWRFSVYPQFRELMDLWGKHDDEVILDYGCGPGNDLVGFLVNTRAKKVIGVDISQKALQFASKRISLHGIDPERVELIRISDSSPQIPLKENYVDYIYTEGVLHHTSNPDEIIGELYRVLKPGGRACIMVYNQDSIWLHLYVAYEQMILEGRFAGMDVFQAFTRTTDTEECPIARCYQSEQFSAMCQKKGFETEYAGGYFSNMELELFKKYGKKALSESKLSQEHKDFLIALKTDSKGLPQYHGKYAGIGGVYRLTKPKR